MTARPFSRVTGWVRRGRGRDDPPSPAPSAGAGPAASSDLPAAVGADQTSRPTFADPRLQADLERYGFAVGSALDDDLLRAVRETYERMGPAPDDPQMAINWSFHSRSSSYKHEVKAELLRLVGPVLDELLVDHEAYLTTFIIKWPGPHGTFAPHQDPSLVDERHFRGVTVWMPLEDTGPLDGQDNGMLYVVPGSHRFSTALRVSDVDRFVFAEHEQAIVERHGLGVPVRAGEVLVFDNRVIHYSLPNLTSQPRVVLSFGVRPREGTCVLLRSRDDLIDIHRIHDDFYIDISPADYHRWEPVEQPLDTLRAVHESWTGEEFDRMCAAVGPAPRTVRFASVPDASKVDPGIFCALCGSSKGLSEADRVGRNNAQLVCPTCREQLDQGVVAPDPAGGVA